MTLDPVVVRGAETIESAARTLLARKVRRLPVVDGDGRLIGLFSRSDVIKVALEARQAALGGQA
jgi:CBS domain-containing protein